MTAPQQKDVRAFIRGVPYARSKAKGRLEAPKVWTDDVVRQTAALRTIEGPCELTVDFVLPANKFPPDFPYGMDLDNLLKRLLDALGQTVLQNAPGRDSAVVSLIARKRVAGPSDETGAQILLREVEFP